MLSSSSKPSRSKQSSAEVLKALEGCLGTDAEETAEDDLRRMMTFGAAAHNYSAHRA